MQNLYFVLAQHIEYKEKKLNAWPLNVLPLAKEFSLSVSRIANYPKEYLAFEAYFLHKCKEQTWFFSSKQ